MKRRLTSTFYITPVDLQSIREALWQDLPTVLPISLDAGRNIGQIKINNSSQFEYQASVYPLPLEFLNKIEERTILKYSNNYWTKWQHFDESTQKFYKMVFVANGKPPTVEISGIKMHTTMDGDPEIDTQNKLKALGKISGTGLDTCMGLGYTPIQAASSSKVDKIFVTEIDQNILKMCKENPWSQELFENNKIKPILSNVLDFIQSLPENYLDFVIHDPPRFALASDLYSIKFYSHLYRTLKMKGKIYHYTGNPNQKTRKVSLQQQSQSLLKQVGFRKVTEVYSGVKAVK